MRIPHKVLIDGHLLGVMQGREVTIELPMGEYDVTIQSMVPFISGTEHVEVGLREDIMLTFSDREAVWDWLMVVDMVLWVLKRFMNLAAPWTWIYEVFTNGYFVLWLVYEWRMRNRYFKFEIQ